LKTTAALTVFKSPRQVRIEIKNILKQYPSSVQQIEMYSIWSRRLHMQLLITTLFVIL